jgi:hypothetical protein
MRFRSVLLTEGGDLADQDLAAIYELGGPR